MRAVPVLFAALACGAAAPLPPVDLAVRLAFDPPATRMGAAARLAVTPVNLGDEVRKHKLTGHVAVLRLTVQTGGTPLMGLQLASNGAPGWTCTPARAGLTCQTADPVRPGAGPRIPVCVRGSAPGDYTICAEIAAEGRTDRNPADNRGCVRTSYIASVDTQVDC